MGRIWTPSQEAAMRSYGKSILVSAAAGSGKTSVLTERIIRSLTDREHPADLSRMLIVTFTRAAAAEMKSRIAESLSAALAENPSDRHLADQLLRLGSAQISTIDSFFQKAVRGNFELLGLPATFRIADESELLPLCSEILEGLIEEFYRKYESDVKEGPLARVEGNRFAGTMDHLLSNRSDGKLVPLLLSFRKHFQTHPEGISLLRDCAEELRAHADKEFFESAHGKALHSELESRYTGYLSRLKQLRDHIGADPDMASRCGALLSSDIDFCNALCNALANLSYTEVRAVAQSFVKGRFPTIKDKPASVAAYQAFRTSFCKDIADHLSLQTEFSPQAIREQMLQTADLCEILFSFYTEYDARIFAEKKARGVFEHNDVRALLCRLLTDENGNATPFAASLATEYDAVYIDEYQDVDAIQDRIFSTIGGQNRFMVGDIKQSIYGFRGSDPSIFAAYRRTMPLYTESLAEQADGVCVFMSENFRCDRPIVDFTNRVCAFLFSACEQSIGYRPQDDLVCSKRMPETLPEAHPAPVCVSVFDAPERKSKQSAEEEDGETRVEEAVWVAAEISQLLREGQKDDGTSITPTDIAILVRNKSHAKAFVKELTTLRIPVASAVSDSLSQDPLLIDLCNLLRAIDNPLRDLPLSEYLLSDLCGFTPEELLEIRDASDPSLSLYEALGEYAGRTASPLALRTSALLLQLERMREEAAVQPADRLLRNLFLEESLLPYANEPAALLLYEQARIYQRSSWCGLYGFLSHIQKLIDGDKLSADGFRKAENAVTVMTVHHSKGLEFPVVFLVRSGSRFNRSDTTESLMFRVGVGGASRLYDPESGERRNTILREAIKPLIDAEQTEEAIRTLYVALTRARERLYVTGTLSGKWETALAGAEQIRLNDRASILGSNSYLTWILAVLKTNDPKKRNDLIFSHHPYGSIEQGIAMDTVEEASDSKPESNGMQRYRNVLENRQKFQYPLSFLHGLPTKAAASKLSPDLLDRLLNEEDGRATETAIELMEAATPSFENLLTAHTRHSAAEIGSATHEFMQFCDFSNLKKNGIDAETERMILQGFLSRQTTELINRRHLEKLLQSELLELILDAETIRREQKFSFYLPLSSFTRMEERQEQLRPHSLFVQGSIDLLLEMKDGSLILVDYKTDRIDQTELDNPELLQRNVEQRHGTQLACYSKAIEAMFGRKPDRVLIYSLSAGFMICPELPIDLL